MPCEYYSRPEIVAKQEKDWQVLQNGRQNPFILYVHHFQVESELEKCRKILKDLVVKNLIGREVLPVQSLTLDETVRLITEYEQNHHEYPSLIGAKELIKTHSICRHKEKYEWEIKNDEEQRNGMKENLRKYHEANHKNEKLEK